MFSIKEYSNTIPCLVKVIFHRYLTMFFDQLKRECSVVPLIVNIRYSSHKWAQNNLSVIFEEINLKYNELCLLNLPSSYSLQVFSCGVQLSITHILRTWSVPLVKCITTALDVRNQVLRAGILDSSSRSFSSIFAPAFRRCSFM